MDDIEIFISHRRADAHAFALVLQSGLARRFGDHRIFFDLDTLKGGRKWSDDIDAALQTSRILIAIIGRDWLTIKNDHGRSRIEEEDDIVRREITTAIDRGIHILPVMLDGVHVPNPQALPEPLRPMLDNQARKLRYTDHSGDMDQILSDLEPLVSDAARAHTHLPAPPPTGDGVPVEDAADLITRAAYDTDTLRAVLLEAQNRGLSPLVENLAGRIEARESAEDDADSQDALITQIIEAQSILNQGRPQEAEQELKRLLPLAEVSFGAEHGTTLVLRYNLAQAILNQGRAQEAEAAFTALLPDQQRVKEKDHPGTLTTRFTLAQAILNQGRAQEAEAALTALLPDEQRVKGKDHTDTLTTRFTLAQAILNQGRAREAGAALTALLSDIQRVKGKDHTDTLTTRHELALAILNQGRAREAEATLTALLPDMQRVKGKDHPDTLTTRSVLAAAILNQGRAQEAEAALTALLPDQQRVKGKDHPDTLTTRSVLAAAILNQGRAQEAEAALTALLPDMQRVKGKDHPDTLATRRLLARAALEQNAPDRAADALAPLPADGGDSNPLRQGQTAMLRGWLADLRGDADGAADLLDTAEQHLAHLEPEHYARRDLARYRATRVPGGAGGTMVWVAEGPDTA